MSQSSKVSKIAPWRCSLNVFVNVFVFVFLVVFLLVRSCFLITLIKCPNGQKAQSSLFGGILKIYLSLSLSLSLFFCWSGHVSSPLWSNVSMVKSSLNVFFIIIVFVFVFVVVFLLVRSCSCMTPKNFARFRFGMEGWKALNPTQSVSEWVSYQGRPRAAKKNLQSLYWCEAYIVSFGWWLTFFWNTLIIDHQYP